MPQSLSIVYIHLVFSTKGRQRFLRDKTVRESLHAFLGGTSKTLGCPPLIVGGVEDHVHLLCRFGRTITQAEWVKELKRVSNGWVKEQGRELRVTLGKHSLKSSTPTGLCPRPLASPRGRNPVWV